MKLFLSKQQLLVVPLSLCCTKAGTVQSCRHWGQCNRLQREWMISPSVCNMADLHVSMDGIDLTLTTVEKWFLFRLHLATSLHLHVLLFRWDIDKQVILFQGPTFVVFNILKKLCRMERQNFCCQSFKMRRCWNAALWDQTEESKI